MFYPVVVSYNGANPKENKLVGQLVKYLSERKIQVTAYDPDAQEPGMKQALLHAQWFVLILTPIAIRSPRVQSLVNDAFDCVKQGQMQGVLALAFLSDLVEPEDMPSLWSTIRTYYVGESNEYEQAFDKLSRTIGYTKSPILPVSSPKTNSSLVSSAAYRPSSVNPRRTQKRQPLLMAILLIAVGFLLGGATTFGLFSVKGGPSTQALLVTPTKSRPRPTVTSHATHTAVTATATPISPSELYTMATKENPVINDPLNQSTTKHNTNEWDINSSCMFNGDETYDVTASTNQYSLCIAGATMYTEDFAYQVQMTILYGNGGGLIFLMGNNQATFYRFSIDQTSTYALSLCKNYSSIRFRNCNPLRTHKITVNSQPTYSLTVIVTNKTIYLYVDGTFIDQWPNSSTPGSGGELGVFAYSENLSTGVAFSNVKVWKLPSSLSH